MNVQSLLRFETVNRPTLYFKMVLLIIIGWMVLVNGCVNSSGGKSDYAHLFTDNADSLVKDIGTIPELPGYQRSNDSMADAFTKYLRGLTLDLDAQVLLYNGSPKSKQNIHYATLNFDVGTRDLQQCADAAIRIRAEYLFHKRQYSDIRFHFVSGDVCSWRAYAKGFRPKVSGSSVSFLKTASAGQSYTSFRNYLDVVYTYAGTASLHHDMKKVGIKDVAPGDVFLQQKSPYGHAVTVLDVAENEAGDKKFIICQSYMPAQTIHVLLNPKDGSPWFSIESDSTLKTPEWNFPKESLYRWK